MIISYVSCYDEKAASTRYRMTIPGKILAKDHEVTVNAHPRMGADVCIFGKLWNDSMLRDIEIAHRESKVILDLCDHHWGRVKHPELSHRYNVGPLFAHVIACPTEEMAKAVNEYTGRSAVVIPDPYEYEEAPPKDFSEQKVLWFGSETNLPHLSEVMSNFKEQIPIVIVTGRTSKLAQSLMVNPWSPEMMRAAFNGCNTVMIPQQTDERNRCKSHNRMVESIRQGLFVVASHHPAYEQFGEWMRLTDNIEEGLQWARENRNELPDRVRAAQDYIRDRFSPETVAKAWEQVINP